MVNTDITTVVSVFAAVGGLVVSLFAYVGYQKSRDRQRAIRKAFDDVIEFLASNNEEHRLAGAILLRRFFDKKSEFGLRTWWWPIKKRAPYAQEAINVTAAVLRGTETCNFQKLLADGLAYAHDLKDVDLQKTNLQNAYLSTERKDKRFNLGGADFYRADLRRASLKGSIVTGGVFYKAILCETVFERADLTGADFTGAILTGAKFEGAELRGAKFKDARNVPQELLAFLDEDDTYNSDQLRPKRTSNSAAKPGTSSTPRVFLSLPPHLTVEQQAHVKHFTRVLDKHGLIAEELPRSEYPQSGQLSEVRRRLSGCSGTVIFGFSQLQGDENTPLPGATGSPPIQWPLTPTPWNHIEAGISFVLDLPLLVMATTELNQGIFDRTIAEQSVYRLPLDSDWSAGSAKTTLSNWTSAVFERACRGS